jgi:hypothetical protein
VVQLAPPYIKYRNRRGYSTTSLSVITVITYPPSGGKFEDILSLQTKAAFAWKGLDKQVSATANKHATIKKLLETVFFIQSYVKRCEGSHKEERTKGTNKDKAKPDIENIRGVNMAAVKLATVQVTKLPL